MTEQTFNNYRLYKDKLAGRSMNILTWLSALMVVMVAVGLFFRSAPLLRSQSIFHLLLSSEWKPGKGEFGFLPFITGTLIVTSIAIIIALPLCLLSGIYISEYASLKVRRTIVPLVDLLSGIPSVVFGVWGVLFIVPFIRLYIAPHFIGFSTGYSMLAGGIVLAIMIFPLLINILLEVFAAIPKELKDASASVGATHWQTIKHVLLKKSLPGIIAAMVLAISRAFGETIAVMMVCGNVPVLPHSVFEAGYPLTALIANNYGEMLSIPMYDAALLFAAFILFAIIFLFNMASRIVLLRLERRLIL